MIEIGRVCLKIVGHEANKKCVVVDTINNSFVLISGPRVKRRRCNVRHLEPLPYKLEIKKSASDSEVADALLKAGIISEKDLPKKPEYPLKPRTKLKTEEEKKTKKILPKKEPKAVEKKAKK